MSPRALMRWIKDRSILSDGLGTAGWGSSFPETPPEKGENAKTWVFLSVLWFSEHLCIPGFSQAALRSLPPAHCFWGMVYLLGIWFSVISLVKVLVLFSFSFFSMGKSNRCRWESRSMGTPSTLVLHPGRGARPTQSSPTHREKWDFTILSGK